MCGLPVDDEVLVLASLPVIGADLAFVGIFARHRKPTWGLISDAGWAALMVRLALLPVLVHSGPQFVLASLPVIGGGGSNSVDKWPASPVDNTARAGITARQKGPLVGITARRSWHYRPTPPGVCPVQSGFVEAPCS